MQCSRDPSSPVTPSGRFFAVGATVCAAGGLRCGPGDACPSLSGPTFDRGAIDDHLWAPVMSPGDVREDFTVRFVAGRIGAESGGKPMSALTILDSIVIATPCQASWDEMPGDDRVHFCATCSRSVYNIAAMTSDEATALFRQSRGPDLHSPPPPGRRDRRHGRLPRGRSRGLTAAEAPLPPHVRVVNCPGRALAGLDGQKRGRVAPIGHRSVLGRLGQLGCCIPRPSPGTGRRAGLHAERQRQRHHGLLSGTETATQAVSRNG